MEIWRANFNSIPRLNFGYYPTPVEELSRLRGALGDKAPRIFIKRDDYTGPGFGGNKVRKLEYLLAKAEANGAEVLITCGGMKSNHARITAALCAKLGLRSILVLNSAAVMYEGWAPASLSVDQLFGAEGIRVGNREERTATVKAVAERIRSEGKKVAVIPLGGSVPLGALGFVRGVGELLGVELQEDATVLDEYTGEGYGIPSPEGDEAIKLIAQTEGIVLDPVYTAKAMAAMIDWIEQGKLNESDNVLFWHTGRQLALFYVPDGAP
jgi:L-cysteate sulfo-lyase